MWEMDPCGERSSRSRNVTTSRIGGFTTPVSGLPKLRIAAYVGCNLSGSNRRLFFFSFRNLFHQRHKIATSFIMSFTTRLGWVIERSPGARSR